MRATVDSDQRRLAAAIAPTRTSSDSSLRVSVETRGWSSEAPSLGLADHQGPSLQVGAPGPVRVAFRRLGGWLQRSSAGSGGRLVRRHC